MSEDPRRTTDARLYRGSVDRVMDEVVAAHAKHGRTFERGNLDRKLRIMTEEVGEIASAIEDVERAADRVDLAKYAFAADPQNLGIAYELQDAEDAHRAAVAHLHVEVAQVGACCLRWLTGEP